MANSESEDFESADEEVTKAPENGRNLHQIGGKSQSAMEQTISTNDSSLAPFSELSCQSTSDEINLEGPPAHTTLQLSVGPPIADASLYHQNYNPECLGAKPKVYSKSKTKSHSKHRNQKETEAASTDLNSSDNPESAPKTKMGPSKLGVKISPARIPLKEDDSPDIDKFKGKGKSKVKWSKNISNTDAVNQDMHDSIQPLLDKLASLDVMDTSEQVTTSPTEKSSGGWGLWGNWGMNTIMSGASSVSNHVSQGLSTVTSVIESGLGAVDPEEMARINVESHKTDPVKSSCVSSPEQALLENPKSGFNVMGNVLRFVESTGEMIVSSGLNTLETIGKKTMDVLQEGDPGLKKKRALFSSREPDKPTLSQVLKEARGKAEIEDRERAQAKQAARAHFETLFDDYRGMIHLEALEMLSNTCQLKLEAKLMALSGAPLVEFQRLLLQVKEQCDIPDEEDEEEDEDRGSIEILERDLSAAMKGLMVPVPHAKLIRVSEDTDTWLATMRCMQDEDSHNENDGWVDEEDISEDADPQSALQEIHQQAIRALARFTATVAEHFHKSAELLLLKEEHNIQTECHSIVLMTSVLCSRVSSVAARFSELLSASANMLESTQVDHNDVNLLITNVFLEASNSSSYIQDASLLLIPVLQLGAVQ